MLVVDDDAITLKRLEQILKKDGYDVTAASDGGTAVRHIRARTFGVILTDLVIDSIDGLDILAVAKERSEETEVIILTGFGSVTSAIDATKKGAFHYLQKPVRPDEVKHIVRQAIKKLELTVRVRELENEVASGLPYDRIIGNSSKILEIKNLIRQIETSDANVLITGESGTGKELVARSIHDTSTKSGGKFLAFNCASFNEELFANELFGHEKDAYTGASGLKKGLLETADNGTVFFDEIGDMPLSLQAKLLRAVQERELIRVGGTTPVPVNVRIISATNRDLKELIANGLFRQDLYFRLNVIHIHLPILSARKGDIPLLAAHFLKRYASRTGKEISGFSNQAMDLLTGYGYPGNIRELENIIEHAVSMSQGRLIKTENLPVDLSEYTTFTFHTQDNVAKTLEEIELEYIHWVLEHVENRKTEAAKILGINRTSLYRKLKRFELDE